MFVAKAMKKNLLVILLLGVLLSCVEKYPVPIRSEQAKLVIDGTISSGKPPYQIQVTYSGVFEYALRNEVNQVEDNAKLTIKDNLGKSTGFKYLGKGLYETTDMSFRGIVGRSYTLLIELPDGRKFTSFPEKMPNAVPMDNIYGEFVKKNTLNTENYFIQVYNPGIPPRYPLIGSIEYAAEPDGPGGYQIYIDSQDPANDTNYYRWTASSVTRRQTTGYCGPFCNCTCVTGESCFVPREHTDLNIFSDLLINGNQIKRKPIFFSPVYATGNIYLEINQFSITREAYQFWKRYQEQLTRTGTILDPLPSPIEGNIYNINNPNDLALGYFSAAGLFRKRAIIPVQFLDFELLPRGVTPRRGACMEVYFDRNPYDVGEWPTPNWSTEVLN